MFVAESMGNELIETDPELLRMDPPNLLRSIPKTFLNGDAIEAVYMPNGYMIKRIYRSNPSISDALDRTDVQEFWNGGGGLATYSQASVSADWTRKWVKGGREKVRILSAGDSPPGGI